MECTIDWDGPNGMLFVSKTGTGHVAVMDGAVEGGGHELAPRHMEMVLPGTGAGLPAAAVERAMQLSHEKYCSASAMLAHTASLEFSVEIVDTAAQAA